MGLNIGDLLVERYRIQDVLGRGGMGVVYRAWDERLQVPVAVKEMSPQVELSAEKIEQLREQFLREARTLARLNHPHLVRVTDFFPLGDAEYLVMDFCAGKSLVEWILQQGALPESQALTIAGQLLDALAYCHENQVYHRDIKPQNVIIRPDGRAVLVDFGLVKQTEPGKMQTMTAIRGMGTPEYAPPEQCDPWSHTDERSDLYSLGATLYHALTGHAPPTITQRIAHPERLEPVRAWVPQVSSRTEKAVHKALHMAVKDRWQSAHEMAEALGVTGPMVVRQNQRVSPPVLQDKTIPMPPPPIVGLGRPRHWPAWTRWAAGGTLALVLLIVGFMTVPPLFQGSATPQATATTAARVTLTPAASATSTMAAATPTPAAIATFTPSPPPSHTPTQAAATATATATLVPTSTPTRATTHTPTAAPTVTPTAAPVSTPRPSPTPARVGTHTPTVTPAGQRLTAPALIAPAQDTSFAGWNAQVVLQWSSVGSLDASEYYVVRVPYDAAGGVAEFWRKDTSLQLPPHFSTSSVGFADRHYNWTVQVMRCTQNCDLVRDDNVHKEGTAAGDVSASGRFFWHPDIGAPGGPGGPGEPAPTNTPPT